MAKLLVTATHPNIKGIAPGKAPTKTENDVLRFKGVYAKTYSNNDSKPKKPQ